jgi:hypothetical protein
VSYRIKPKELPIIAETDGYYAWLASLNPGDEVAFRKEGSFWRSRNQKIQTVIENSDKDQQIILSNGTKINRKTGREIYIRTSYSDRGVHVLPVTDELRYEVQYDEVSDRFGKALSKSDNKFTINEMEQLIKFSNKLVTKRKSHHPVVEGDVNE